MAFLDTAPAPIQALEEPGPWAKFRVVDPRKRIATLRELKRSDLPITVGPPAGPSFLATLWAFDENHHQVHLSVPPDVPEALVRNLCRLPELWAAAYLQDAKVQFDLQELTAGPRGATWILSAIAPRLMVHLPRRRAVRVRSAADQGPLAIISHPRQRELKVRLKLGDLSLTGCSLMWPATSPVVPSGSMLQAVEIELDHDTFFYADLVVHHLAVAGSQQLLRVGCEWRGLSSQAADTLQTWIAHGRRRRDLVTLSFD